MLENLNEQEIIDCHGFSIKTLFMQHSPSSAITPEHKDNRLDQTKGFIYTLHKLITGNFPNTYIQAHHFGIQTILQPYPWDWKTSILLNIILSLKYGKLQEFHSCIPGDHW